jgi:hypothetical protein
MSAGIFARVIAPQEFALGPSQLGTDGSNPSPSSGGSLANLAFGAASRRRAGTRKVIKASDVMGGEARLRHCVLRVTISLAVRHRLRASAREAARDSLGLAMRSEAEVAPKYDVLVTPTAPGTAACARPPDPQDR